MEKDATTQVQAFGVPCSARDTNTGPECDCDKIDAPTLSQGLRKRMQHPVITLDQWQTLLSVVERGGIAEAADELGMSHSAVTLTITRMQEALGLEIVDVDGKTARFTAAGASLAQRARMLLRDARAVEELADNLRLGWENQIRVAFDNTFPIDTMVEALRNFSPLSRGTQVTIRETGTAEAEAALHAGSVDVVITTRVPDGYLSEPLTTLQLMAVTAPKHPFANAQGAISAYQLACELVVEVRDAPRARVLANESAPRWTVASNDTARAGGARVRLCLATCACGAGAT